MPAAVSAPASRFAGVDTVTDPRALQGLAKSDDPESIKAAAREFESLFMHQLFKSMRATVPKDGMMDSGMGGEMFTDMLDQEYAKQAAEQGGIGLADIVAEQLGAEQGPGGGQHELKGPDGTETMVARRALRALRAYQSGAAGSPMAHPCATGRVSSEYGLRRLSDDAAPRMHDGLDIAAPSGTPIQSALGGTVRHAGWIKGYGNTVIVDHGGGRSTLYAHASELLVESGTQVTRGQEIARVGSTGHSTGPHLHFEVREDGKTVDPRLALGLR
jgi:murein DD-endopeptidase MepM/ murein hydrolase activator NlpD